MRLPGTRTPDEDERGCEVLMKTKGNCDMEKKEALNILMETASQLDVGLIEHLICLSEILAEIERVESTVRCARETIGLQPC